MRKIVLLIISLFFISIKAFSWGIKPELFTRYVPFVADYAYEELNDLPLLESMTYSYKSDGNNEFVKYDYEYNFDQTISKMIRYYKSSENSDWQKIEDIYFYYMNGRVNRIIFNRLDSGYRVSKDDPFYESFYENVDLSISFKVIDYIYNEKGALKELDFKDCVIYTDGVEIQHHEVYTYEYDHNGNIINEMTVYPELFPELDHPKPEEYEIHIQEFDDQNRLIKSKYESQHASGGTSSGWELETFSPDETIITYSVDPDNSLNTLAKDVDYRYENELDSSEVTKYEDIDVIDERGNVIVSYTKAFLVKDGVETELVDYNSTVYTYSYTYENDLLKVVTSERDGEDIDTKEYIYNDNGDLLSVSYVSKNEDLDFEIVYRKEGQAQSLNTEDNQTFAIAFNYALDSTADFSNIVALEMSDLKTTQLSIENVYVSAEDSKVLIIELNRPVEISESFEIYSTQDLPLQDGRFVPLSIVASGLQATSTIENDLSQTSITQLDSEIIIENANGIEAVSLVSTNGITVEEISTQGINYVSVKTAPLKAGVYILQVTVQSGNSSGYTIFIQ